MLQYSPSGGYLAAVHGDRVCVYATLTYTLEATLTGHAEEVTDVAWSRDGFRLATCSQTSVYLWSTDTMQRYGEDTTRTWASAAVLPDPAFHSVLVADAFWGLRYFSTARGGAGVAAAAAHEGAVELHSAPAPGAGAGAAPRLGAGGAARGEDVESLQLVSKGLGAVRRPVSCMVFSQRHGCVVAKMAQLGEGAAGADRTGSGSSMLIVPFPPCNDVALEATPHRAAVRAVAVDAGGDIVFSCDASGIVLMHALVSRTPPLTPEAQVGAAVPSHTAVPATSGSTMLDARVGQPPTACAPVRHHVSSCVITMHALNHPVRHVNLCEQAVQRLINLCEQAVRSPPRGCFRAVTLLEKTMEVFCWLHAAHRYHACMFGCGLLS